MSSAFILTCQWIWFTSVMGFNTPLGFANQLIANLFLNFIPPSCWQITQQQLLPFQSTPWPQIVRQTVTAVHWLASSSHQILIPWSPDWTFAIIATRLPCLCPSWLPFDWLALAGWQSLDLLDQHATPHLPEGQIYPAQNLLPPLWSQISCMGSWDLSAMVFYSESNRDTRHLDSNPSNFTLPAPKKDIYGRLLVRPNRLCELCKVALSELREVHCIAWVSLAVWATTCMMVA